LDSCLFRDRLLGVPGHSLSVEIASLKLCFLAMLQPAASSEVLAHWRYSPDEWRDFISHETKHYHKIFKTLKYSIIIVVVVVVLVVTSLLLIPLLWLGSEFGEKVLAPPLAIAILAGIFVIVLGGIWLVQRDKFARLCAKAGDVYITLNEVNMNGIRFDWGYEELGWRLLSVERQIISIVGKPAKSMEIIEITCRPHYISSMSEPETKVCRIPIPAGNKAEAERVLERLLSMKNFIAKTDESA
jgi:hypothetical protein